MCAQPRVPYLHPGAIPREPGIYAWFRDGQPVYSGKATGSGGLAGRLAYHLATGVDLSRSSFRRNVAEQFVGLPTAFTRLRPPRVTLEQAAAVTSWLAACELTWQIHPSAALAVAAETALHREWLPPLSKR
jgi:hypothetical protein